MVRSLMVGLTAAVSFVPELTAFNPGEVTVGGEIGHHFDLTVGKILNHCDFENDFLRYFRERTPGEAGVEGDNEKNGGPYNGFVGIGMFLDSVVKACVRGIGGAPLRTFKDKAIADLIATQGSGARRARRPMRCGSRRKCCSLIRRRAGGI